MQQPLVSIIIPTYNRVHLIGETLDSVLAQTYENWECIVVDDGSTDETNLLLLELMDSDKRFRYLVNQYKKGGPGARNTGLKNSRGSHVVFLDSDDLLKKDCLEKRVKYVYKNPELDFLIFQSQFFLDIVGDINKIPNYLIKEKNDLERFIIYDYPWNISSGIINKDFMLRNNIYWDEQLSIHQDLDFYIRILITNPKYKKIIDIPDVLIRSNNNDKLSQCKNSYKILEGKYLYLRNIINYTEASQVRVKYDLQIYGLALSLIELFLKEKQYVLFFKVSSLFVNNKFYINSILLMTDAIYFKLRSRFYNKYFRKMLDIYLITNLNYRKTYLPPGHSTLGKPTIEDHLKQKDICFGNKIE